VTQSSQGSSNSSFRELKTSIICTISQENASFQETLNTLHFGSKAKTIKTLIKVNEILDEKSKILQENNSLKSKIRQLEGLCNDKMTGRNNNNNNINMMNIEDENTKSQNDMLNDLEKEVLYLKKMLTSSNNNGEMRK